MLYAHVCICKTLNIGTFIYFCRDTVNSKWKWTGMRYSIVKNLPYPWTYATLRILLSQFLHTWVLAYKKKRSRGGITNNISNWCYRHVQPNRCLWAHSFCATAIPSNIIKYRLDPWTVCKSWFRCSLLSYIQK